MIILKLQFIITFELSLFYFTEHCQNTFTQILAFFNLF